jgi:hypothetical protein
MDYNTALSGSLETGGLKTRKKRKKRRKKNKKKQNNDKKLHFRNRNQLVPLHDSDEGKKGPSASSAEEKKNFEEKKKKKNEIKSRFFGR